MSLPQLRLDKQLCFLVHCLERRVTQLYRRLLEPLGVTYPQYLVLLALWESGEAGVGELAARLHLDTGTVSPLLKRMERSGLVRRERDRADERSVRVSLTPRSKALEKKAEHIPAELVRCLGGGRGVNGARFVRDLRSLLDAAGRIL